MSLTDEERSIVVEQEKMKALNTFAEVDILRQAGLWNNINNRLYYSAFHAVCALLISNHRKVGSHQGAVVMLNQYYVLTGLLSKDEGRFYSQLQTQRELSDYNCTYYATEEDTVPRIAKTKQFIDKVLSLINQR